MSKRSLGSIIKEVLIENDLHDDDSSVKQCRRGFTRLIEKLGGNIDDMKNSKNVIEFDEAEVPGIKFLLRNIFISGDNSIGDFLYSKDKDFSAEEARKFIDYVASELCASEKVGTKEQVVEYLSDIFLLSHLRIIEECHTMIDIYAGNLQHQLRAEKLLSLQSLRDEITKYIIMNFVKRAYTIAEISNDIELSKDGEAEIDCIYEGFPTNNQTEYIQRDIEILKAIQEDDDLREYIEKKTGKKAEDIFNYRALTDFTLIFKKKDTEN